MLREIYEKMSYTHIQKNVSVVYLFKWNYETGYDNEIVKHIMKKEHFLHITLGNRRKLNVRYPFLDRVIAQS